jgi:hypothetical protein
MACYDNDNCNLRTNQKISWKISKFADFKTANLCNSYRSEKKFVFTAQEEGVRFSDALVLGMNLA